MDSIWFPLQRALRTAAQVVVTLTATLATVAIVAPQVLEALSDVLPGPVVGWLTIAIATVGAVSAALSRVMAIPAVNKWLTNIGLGTAPKGSISYTFASGTSVGLTRRQWRAYLADQLAKDTKTEDKSAAVADNDSVSVIRARNDIE